MDTYYSVITAKGKPKLAAALLPDGTPLAFAEMAFGDGGGAAVTPVENREALVGEVHRRAVNSVDLDPDNPGWVIVRAVLPPEIGGWTIREVGLFDVDGDLVTYGNFATSYKPVLAQGSGKELIIEIYLEVGSAAQVALQINPSIVTATHTWVQQQIEQAQRNARARRYYFASM